MEKTISMTEELIATLRKENAADDDRLEYGSGQRKYSEATEHSTRPI